MDKASAADSLQMKSFGLGCSRSRKVEQGWSPASGGVSRAQPAWDNSEQMPQRLVSAIVQCICICSEHNAVGCQVHHYVLVLLQSRSGRRVIFIQKQLVQKYQM